MSTLNPNSVRMPLVRSDQYAEIEAADALKQLGFEVRMLGGKFKMSDGIAERKNLRIDVQVKGSAKESSYIDWRKSGEPAREYAASAASTGRIAVFMFVHALEVSEAYLCKGEIRFPRPKVKIYATTATQFADDVDESRRSYANEPYSRGPKKGHPRPESGCILPVRATSYPLLEEFIEQLNRKTP